MSLIIRLDLLNRKHLFNKIAITNGDISLTYLELARQIELFSDWLEKQSVSCVGLHIQNSLDWVIVDLACQNSKLICVPLPDFFSKEQINNCIKQAGVDLYIAESLPEYIDDGIKKISLQVFNEGLPLTALFIRLKENTSGKDNAEKKYPKYTQKITFTSGSTGLPKGVCLSAEHQWNTAQSLVNTININEPDHLCLLPLSTLLENIAGVYVPLLSGGTITLPTNTEKGISGSSSLNIQALLNCISNYQIDSFILFPQLLMVLVEACEQGWSAPRKLQFIAVGGGKVAHELLNKAVRLGLPVFEGYGLSECASVVALNTANETKIGSVGKILPHCEVSFLKQEIVLSGSTFLGYLNDKLSWHLNSVHTGDIGYMDDGYLFICGRKKNILISSYGRNINPEWVESELMTSALLTQCVVVGDAKPFLIAIIGGRKTIPSERIMSFIEQVNTRLPDYARVKKIIRVNHEQWANYLTPNGKVKRDYITADLAKKINEIYENG